MPESVIKLSEMSYQLVTSEDVAAENQIKFIPDVYQKKISTNWQYENQFMAEEGKYISFYPPNDGCTTCPIEWYGKFKNEIQLIMSNQTAYKEITNLAEIISQMVKLYVKYIDHNVFIASTAFALELKDEVKPNYIGKASLVITKSTICNSRVGLGAEKESKITLINEFLDHFIGWNFGVVIKNNPELEEELLDFQDLVIFKGLRQNIGKGFLHWSTKDVKPYVFEY